MANLSNKTQLYLKYTCSISLEVYPRNCHICILALVLVCRSI